MRKCLAHLLLHSQSIVDLHMLWQISNCDIFGDCHRARRGRLNTGDDLEHRGFAGAVLAHESYAVTRIDDVVDIVKKSFGRELHRKVLYGNHMMVG